MNKEVLNELAKSIKHMDSIIWRVNEPEKSKISDSRRNLINIIFAAGYELSESYRVIKSKTQRELI